MEQTCALQPALLSRDGGVTTSVPEDSVPSPYSREAWEHGLIGGQEESGWP